MHDLGPWLVLAGLGAFHGINPAMGWLFAVALGLHRNSRRVVMLSLLPIAAGHALSVALMAGTVLIAGTVVDYHALHVVAGALLLVWAVRHALRGHGNRVRIGLRTGLGGLLAWSFLMASAHGAGLMLVPVLMPMTLHEMSGHSHATDESVTIALAGFGVHTGAMIAVTGLTAALVYQWVGVGVLRRGWINLDLLWSLALGALGMYLVLNAVAP